ncbi:extracellular solute-binding protein [Pinisolibacter aquiterrae]|uniref:extracellular solute-binding protein n=1 Tax=Pinisolibacter aquiterrae TaxID=2815579 RepID=UPI001C3D82B8|nr:extracellular solute-binding protein [Pinisolibacter aquiterrae]
MSSRPRLTRRETLALAAAGLAFPIPRAARAEEGAAAPVEGARHGFSIFGDLKYPADFTRFDWVNPDAPKGGALLTQAATWSTNQNPSTFNSLHDLILKGDAAVGMDLTRAALMTRAHDEPDAVYGLVAESLEIRDGGATLVFRLRPAARFSDGAPVTADDVVFSLTTLKAKGHPQISELLREMVSAEAAALDRVVVRLSQKRGRGLPAIVATMPVLSKAWWAKRDFEASSLEPEPGCGPYRVGRFEAGRFIEYEAVAGWWGADLPVARGRWNFRTIRYDFYRERTAAFEAFKAGATTLREEFVSLAWATQYDFPALADGRVKKIELEDHSPSGAQGWFLNTRREIFADPRVREAIGLAFDFEWSNKNLFFGSYLRTPSFFVNSELEATGLPDAAERALLEPFRGKVPDEVFGEAWRPPVSDGSGRDRSLLRRASVLLTEAGWTRKGDRLVDARGRPMEIEFLEAETSFARITGPFVNNLRALGIDARERVVDPSQFEKRVTDFDFDVVSRRWSLGATPDDGVRQFWHSSSRDTPGSNNLAGIADPAVDALVETLLAAPTREVQLTAAHALDRVLRAGRWWVPHWYKADHWIAAWDVYERPKVKPRYDRAIESTWWVDAARAKALGKGL